MNILYGQPYVERLEKEGPIFDAIPGPDVGQNSDKGLYFFLHGYSGYKQISIALEDQDNTTFTLLCGTFSFKHMSWGCLMFQRPSSVV